MAPLVKDLPFAYLSNPARPRISHRGVIVVSLALDPAELAGFDLGAGLFETYYGDSRFPLKVFPRERPRTEQDRLIVASRDVVSTAAFAWR